MSEELREQRYNVSVTKDGQETLFSNFKAAAEHLGVSHQKVARNVDKHVNGHTVKRVNKKIVYNQAGEVVEYDL